MSTDCDSLLKFLLYPVDEHVDVDQQLAVFAQAEMHALDRYLDLEAGGRWADAKYAHRLSPLDNSWRSFWPARVAYRLMLMEKERGNPNWAEILAGDSNRLRLHPFEYSRVRTCQVVFSGGFLDTELARSYHPSITGSRLFCESPTPDRLVNLTERYRLALWLLEKHDPQGFAVFAGSVSAITPLQLDPPLEVGKCVSLSIAAAPGVVLLTMTPIILLSETLLHEAAHCRLSAAEDLVPLWSSSGVRVVSPLRPDPRPIAGLYHQAYVLFWLSRYFRRLREATGESVVQRNHQQIVKRLDELTTGFRDAIASLRTNRRELTPIGERLVEELASGNLT